MDTIIVENEVPSVVVFTTEFGPQGPQGIQGPQGPAWPSQGVQQASESARDTALAAAADSTAKAGLAATSATQAATSAAAAATSATATATSITQVNQALATATAYNTSMSTAVSSANTSAQTATQKAAEAANFAEQAATSYTRISDIFVNFDDRFLGTKAADPLKDNYGQNLAVGAIYYNSLAKNIRFYNGITWDIPSVSASQAAASATDSALTATGAASIAVNANNSAQQAAQNAQDSATAAATSAQVLSTASTNAYNQVAGLIADANSITNNAVAVATEAASQAQTAATAARNSEKTVTSKAGVVAANVVSVENFASQAGTAAQNANNYADAALASAVNAQRIIWRSGDGVPPNSLGINNDYYLNTNNGDVYVKTGNTYVYSTNIRGRGVPSGGQPGQALVKSDVADYYMAWANLFNADTPGPIGTTAPNTGKFTTIQSTVTTGTAPFIIASTTPVANLSIGGNAATATVASNMPYSGLTGTIPVWNQDTTGTAAKAINVPYSGLTGTIPIWNQNTTGNAATATLAATANNVPYSGLTGTVPTWNQDTTGTAAKAINVPYSGLTGTVPIWNQNTTGNAATATLAVTATNVAYSGLTGTVPTWNQDTTGNAATATLAVTATNVSYSGLTGTIPIWNQDTTGIAANITGTYTGSISSGQVTVGLGYTPENPANRGVANGYVPLDSTTKIAAVYLPSYVDDVLEAANLAAFPQTGEIGKIYVAVDSNKTYRWSGTVYTEISASPGSTDAVTEGASNLYFTTARARAALSFSQNLSYDSATGAVTGPDLSSYLTSVTGNNFAVQTAKTVLAAPNATDGKPVFRVLVASDLPTISYNDLSNKPTLFSGSYSDLTNKPTLFSGAYSDLTSKPTLFSGSYTDLSNKPTIPAAQIQSNWTQTEAGSLDYIKNKPTLFSGSYSDLTNKPTLFSGSYSDLTSKPTLFSGSYTDLSNKPTIPNVYTLTAATNSSLGGVIAGSNLSVSGTGNLTYNAGYTETLSNKRFQPRVQSQTVNTSSVDWNSDNFDQINLLLTVYAAITINVDGGTTTYDGQKIMFRIKDDGSARNIALTVSGAKCFKAVGVTLPTSTTAGKTTYIGCIYNSSGTGTWDVIAIGTEA